MKNKYNIIILAFATLLFVFSSSCKKWDPTDLIYEVEGIQYSDGMSGFGNNDAEIEGTEFSFPEGIILAEEVAGAKSTDIPKIEKPGMRNFRNFVQKPIQFISKTTRCNDGCKKLQQIQTQNFITTFAKFWKHKNKVIKVCYVHAAPC